MASESLTASDAAEMGPEERARRRRMRDVLLDVTVEVLKEQREEIERRALERLKFEQELSR